MLMVIFAFPAVCRLKESPQKILRALIFLYYPITILSGRNDLLILINSRRKTLRASCIQNAQNLGLLPDDAAYILLD